MPVMATLSALACRLVQRRLLSPWAPISARPNDTPLNCKPRPPATPTWALRLCPPRVNRSTNKPSAASSTAVPWVSAASWTVVVDASKAKSPLTLKKSLTTRLASLSATACRPASSAAKVWAMPATTMERPVASAAVVFHCTLTAEADSCTASPRARSAAPLACSTMPPALTSSLMTRATCASDTPARMSPARTEALAAWAHTCNSPVAASRSNAKSPAKARASPKRACRPVMLSTGSPNALMADKVWA